MKKFISIAIVVSLILGSLVIIAESNDGSFNEKTQSESIKISKPTITNADEYISVDFEQATSYILEPGRPKLPMFTKVFVLPFGSKIVDVDVTFADINEMELEKKVQPAPEPNPVSSMIQISDDTSMNEEIYKSSELYPSSCFSYSIGAGLKDNNHVNYLSVQCYPVRYSPANNRIYYTNDINIKAIYDEPTHPIAFSDEYDLVVIAPSEFSNELQPLINHKISMGVNTFLKTTEDIYSGYSGFDQAEKIKYFIKYAVETMGVDYVLLVGSVDKLPIRISYATFWGDGLITDLYYADIYDENGSFCSWDGNKNGIFGETYHDHHEFYDIDGVDLYPDVNLGRLPCINTKEVKKVVNKIIHYETETYGESWFNNIILVGGDTFPGHDGNEGEELNLLVEQIMSGFTPTKLWTSDNTFSARAFNNAINNGAGFVDYSGHGFEIGVATHPPNSDENAWVTYHTNRLLGAMNGYKLPIVFWDACLTSKLDFDVSNLTSYLSEDLSNIISQYTIGSKLLPCFTWFGVAKSSGGFIAAIGATRTAFGGFDDGAGGMSLRFWQAYSTSETVSEMMTKAQNDYIATVPYDYFTVEEFILIGDPSLKVGGYPQSNGLKARIVNAEESIDGYPNTPLQFQASANNGQSPYVFAWDFDEDGIYDDATGETVKWTWSFTGVYRVGLIVTDANNNKNTYSTIVNIESKPNKPYGSVSAGIPGIEYTFNAQMQDGDVKEQTYVCYYFDWGDGTFSGMLGPYPSDSPAQATHVWASRGSYQVRVKFLKIDFKNLVFEETGWSDPFTITISKNRALYSMPLIKFLETHTKLFPHLRHLLGLYHSKSFFLLLMKTFGTNAL